MEASTGTEDHTQSGLGGRALALASDPEGSRPQSGATPAALQVELGQGLSCRGPDVPGVGPEYGKEPLLFLGYLPSAHLPHPRGPIFIPQNLLEVCLWHLGMHWP